MSSNVKYQGISPNTYVQGLAWASGATSASADLNGAKLIGIAYPSGMTNTSISLRKRVSGTFYPMTDNFGTALSVTVATGSAQFAYFNPADVASLEGGVQFVGAATGGEAAARSLILVLRAL